MLISSEVIDHVKWSIEQISKWNPTKVLLPFSLTVRLRSEVNQDDSNKDDYITSYEFRSNLGNFTHQWFYPMFIFGAVIASSIYQLIYEDKLLEEFITHCLQVAGCLSVILFDHQQHSKAYLNFLNQLLSF